MNLAGFQDTLHQHVSVMSVKESCLKTGTMQWNVDVQQFSWGVVCCVSWYSIIKIYDTQEFLGKKSANAVSVANILKGFYNILGDANPPEEYQSLLEEYFTRSDDQILIVNQSWGLSMKLKMMMWCTL